MDDYSIIEESEGKFVSKSEYQAMQDFLEIIYHHVQIIDEYELARKLRKFYKEQQENDN